MRRMLIVLLAFVVVGCGTGSDTSAPEETVAAMTTILETTSTTADPPTTTEASVTPTAVVPTITVDATAPAEPAVRSITVGGMGAEYVEPDRCVVDIGVTSRRPTVQESAQAAAASGEAMTAALTAAGGDDARAWGVRFEADTTGLLEIARERAWADVEARAASLAGLANEPLGLVLDAHEKVLISSSQGMMQGGEGDSAAFDIPVSPGVSGVVVLLTVTFAIGE